MRYTTIGSDALSARTVSVLSLGAMRFGTTTDEATSFAILDRYVAAAAGGARADVLQYHHTYLRMRRYIPDLRFSPDGEIGVADGSILSYLRAEPGMTLVAYSPLLNGAYTRPDKEPDRAYDHPGTSARLGALGQVVKETGATANQVVLAWLIGGDLPVVPLIGASSVEQSGRCARQPRRSLVRRTSCAPVSRLERARSQPR
jgi:aryl-alcohol dehydrogenase-like predicted oxidoreductase